MPHAVFPDDEIVHEICRRLSAGESIISISRDTKYSYDAISAIKHHRNWVHISSQYTFPKCRDRNALTIKQAEVICQMLADGVPDFEIAKDLNVKIDNVRKISNKNHFCDISDKYFI